MDLKNLESKTFKGKARTQLLAQIEFIREALEAGYPKAVIWRELTERSLFEAKYDQFLDYIQKYLDSKKRPDKALELKSSKTRDSAELPANSRTPETKAAKSKESAPLVPKHFTWNPHPLTSDEIKSGIITSR